MSIIHLKSFNDDRIKPYVSLTEAQLRSRVDPASGIFIAESPKVIRLAINAGLVPLSMLCEERHINGDAHFILELFPEIDVFTGSRELLANITGYTLTRGVLCAMKRPQLPAPALICASSHRVAVIDGVVDTTNIGAIFRSAAALDIDAILVTPTSCDPLNRRAVRCSMGTIFQVPWTWCDTPVETLHTLGYETVAMALSSTAIYIDNPLLHNIPRLAIIMGNEGDGLSSQVIDSCTYVAKIPMSHDVDSLNVAAAAAVAFWQLRKR